MKIIRWTSIVLLAACSAAPSPGSDAPAPPTTPALTPRAPPAPSSARTVSSTRPIPAPTFAPKEPFSVVARAPRSLALAVHPSSDGDAWIVATPRGAATGTGARWARLRGATVHGMPGRGEGLDAAPSIIASRGDAAWAAVLRASPAGPPSCEVFEWSTTTWTSRGRSRGGVCTHLAPWTPGAAVAAVGDGTLEVFGNVTGHVPILDDPPRGSGRLASVSALRAWEGGEITVVGTRVTPDPAVVIHRFGAGASRSVTTATGIDYNSPFVAIVPTKDEVWVDGFGVIGTEVETARLVARFDGARFRLAPLAKHRMNDFENMMVSGPSIVGVLDGEGKATGAELASYVVEGETIYAVVEVADGTGEVLVLRNRPVDRVHAFAP